MHETPYQPVFCVAPLHDSYCSWPDLTFITLGYCSFVFMEYANQALREMNLQQRKRKKHNKRIQQEINVLLIMFKIIYDTANFIHFHKINTRE